MKTTAIAALLLASWSAVACADEGARYRPVGESFMKLLDANNTDAAVDWTDSSESLLHKAGPRNPDLPSLKKSLREAVDAIGRTRGHVLAREQNAGDRLVQLDYLLLGEHKPLLIELVLYRYENDWALYSWGWYSDPRELFSPRGHK